MSIQKILLIAPLILAPSFLWGNGLSVSNASMMYTDTAANYATIQFNVGWENAWRDTSNWDAIWVFVKFRETGTTGAWSHATLNYVTGINDGHTGPDSLEINTPSDGKGVFLYRADTASGTVIYNNVQLRWNYAIDGVDDNVNVDIRVYGIEMVYVAQGAYWLGDGSDSLHGQFENDTSGTPFQVTSEDSITLGGGTAGSLGNNNRVGMVNNGVFSISPYSIDDFNDTSTQTLPAAFPKGFDAFYCMKYELTQGAYVDFLNAIDSTQAAGRYNSTHFYSSNGGAAQTRYNVTGTYPNFTTATPDLTCVYIEYYDGAAYADWTGLRPMTELEFEKACRGPLAAVADEYAWGTASVNTNSHYIVNNLGTSSETVGVNYSLTAGNAWYTQTRGISSMIRTGAFAAHPFNTGRVSAGATYWGIMDMSGNCWERCVSVGRPEGRAFAGTHGDGNLMANGNATNADWPGYNPGQGVNEAYGCGYRGAGYDFPNPTGPNMRTSSRILATAFYHIRYYDDTMRLVRTAP